MESTEDQNQEAVSVQVVLNRETFYGKNTLNCLSYLSHGGGNTLFTLAKSANEKQNTINLCIFSYKLK